MIEKWKLIMEIYIFYCFCVKPSCFMEVFILYFRTCSPIENA
jgi:hypothetical protein